MSELTMWMNREIIKLKQDMDRLFARMYRDFAGERIMGEFLEDSPSVSLSESKDTLVVRIQLPGIDPENIDVVVAEDSLEISSAITEQYSRNDRQVEKSHSFSHRMKLPCRIKTDEVQASHLDGGLEIVMPKLKPHPARHLKIAKK